MYTKVNDSLVNLVSGINTSRDKSAHSYFQELTITDVDLQAMYRSCWLAAKIIDIVADDMVSHWRSYNAPKLDSEQIEALEMSESQLRVKTAVNDALRWGRLYGGAVAVLKFANEKYDAPIEVGQIRPNSLEYVYAYSRRSVTPAGTSLIEDVKSPHYLTPEYYDVTKADGSAVTVHASRVLRFVPVKLPPDEAVVLQYWGIPVLQRVYDAVRDAMATPAATAALVQEASVDVLQVKDLWRELKGPGGVVALTERFSLGARMKSLINMLVLDQSENYEKKTTNFTALPQLVSQNLNTAAAASDIPATILLGESAPGLNATGEAEEKKHNARISVLQEKLLRPQLEYFDTLWLQSELGGVPDGWSFDFNPLAEVNPTEIADIQLKNMQRDTGYSSQGIVPDSVIAKSLRNSGVYEDMTDDIIEVLEEAEEPVEEPEGPTVEPVADPPVEPEPEELEVKPEPEEEPEEDLEKP